MTSASHSPGEGVRPSALVTGASGQLGSTIAERLASRWSITPMDVDGAETAAHQALAVNALAVGTLARAAKDVGAAFVHYSTDFVFDGRAERVHREQDAPEPQSTYGQSKLIGEWLAADAPVHYVLRVESLFGGSLAKSSIDRIIAAIVEGREARVFIDRTVSPSFVDDVAEATAFLVGARAPGGVYHVVNSGCTTWFDIARHVAERLERPQAILTPVSVKELQLKAKRPQFAALANDKLTEAGFRMPLWQDALERHLARAHR
ncbi:MAG: NAD(P)-dependent oxidoreductase [Acidobacteria bacterium]|nr:NAD(P)-dependent oxidoreductase [Acidobacteriota bacterium]